MSTWLMNSLFRKTAYIYKFKYFTALDKYLSNRGAQVDLHKDLVHHEKNKRSLYHWTYKHHTSNDLLERVIIKSLGELDKGNLNYAEYLKIRAKVDDMKKIRFAENYDGYKVATDLGGTKERELFKLYDQVIRNERGELAHKLWREKVEKDPQARSFLGHW
mmetsp:Transcript_33413/g.38372  ORF Transcript_33413/g.38372 Transcript_33413/m.38372 type:complete len:161 (-) Transcript_33413:1-483(-)